MAELNHKGRAHAFLGASKAELWLNCPGSATANSQYEREESSYAAEGTAAHEVAQTILESCLLRGFDVDGYEGADLNGKPEVTLEMLECAQGYCEYIQELMPPGGTVLVEQRLDYSTWVPGGFGTADCIVIAPDVITIVDYKYGKGVAVSAEDNPQMKLYALGVIQSFDCVYDFSTVRMAIYQPRMNNVSEYTLTVADLLDWAENVVAPVAAKAYKGSEEYHAGPWCQKFCQHAGRCRALTVYCSDFVRTHGGLTAVPHLAPKEYLEIFQAKPLIETWLKKTLAAATDSILAGNPVEGLKVVEGRSSRKWADPEAVEQFMQAEEYDQDAYMEPAKLMTPAALEKSLGKKKVAELLGDRIVKSPGNPTLVLASDKRKAYDPGADFDVIG
nr:MAG TPA: Protein of unknown function (DUF2800) [Caudoviricetes sp.]